MGVHGSSSTATTLSDFDVNAARNKLPGLEGEVIRGRSEDIGTGGENVLTDVWGLPTNLVHATVGETWEIVSTSPNDTIAGTGAQSIVMEYLDDNYVRQTEPISLNGTTPVAFTATDSFRFQDGEVTTVGNLGFNDGLITIRVAGGGANRGALNYSTKFGRGLNRSFDSHYTVEAGKILIIKFAVFTTGKGVDATVIPMTRDFGSNVWLPGSEVSEYQSSNQFEFSNSFALIDEKSDVKFMAASSNEGSIIGLSIIGYLINK